ncbi:sensor histidine kinase [Flavobacterium bernardetii]|uniref:sensor histidine kinase n=1 Tax=Flavobacterium bernardetii TaxID=2813823 RepID=UPI00197AD818|nr:sensor histidine kinase [Flavobacterium bernardetii]
MKKSIVYLIHTAFWLAYFLLLLVIIAAATQGFSSGPNFENILKVGIPFVVIPSFSAFYLFYFYLFPKYVKTRKIGLSFVYGILFSIGSAFVGGFFLTLIFGKIFMFEGGWSSFFAEIITMSLIGLFAGTMSVIIKGFITWYDEIQLKETLNLKNHQIELALVKSQLDPHFLFNTINNIDILLLKDAQLASEYLNKLSDILRFMLFETKTEKIALTKEIEYIEKYIALQKIRTSNDNFVNFIVKGEAANHSVSPMLFIPFIENAFKHVSNKKTENAITVSLVIEKEKIVFECENKYNENKTFQSEFNGLGNELIKKRIELMYPKKHNLAIIKENDTYKVNLTLAND